MNSATNKFKLKQINMSQLRKCMSSLKNTKSTGSCGLSINMVKNISESVLPIILKITNNIIEHRVFPDCLKISKIIPIPKDKDFLNMKNFRPINLLSPISKIIEKTWSIQIMEYLTKNQMINNNHQGGIKGRSTTITALKLHQKLIEILDKKKVGALIALDQSACFDVIKHDILIKKMKHIGFDENTIQILRNYMKNREQYVIINTNESKKK